MRVYYNECAQDAADTLENLMRLGLIPGGVVDRRSIVDVQPEDLKDYDQCHFFAGIGGWAYAVELAGMGGIKGLWTGSCPCQPFSTAGKRRGKEDKRHLWPEWFRLIRQCRPTIIFGEQVAAAIAHGWWDEVATNLEIEGYACGAAVLPACSVGTPHKRERLWFVGNAQHHGLPATPQPSGNGAAICNNTQGQNCASELAGTGNPQYVANAQCFGLPRQRAVAESLHSEAGGKWQADKSFNVGAGVLCPDGKQRPIKPSLPLLVDGLSGNVAFSVSAPAEAGEKEHWYSRKTALKGFGNAIVPQVAAAFMQAAVGN